MRADMTETTQFRGRGTKRGPQGAETLKRIQNLLESLFVLALAFYPLRHVNIGLDLWDTGYNYANYQYVGTEHMDPMWLFATYLSNGVGHFLTGLPNGNTLRGMNIYTGLFVSAFALAAYFFCVREIKMRPWVAFLGEFTALNLCWCPTAKLYDYITYGFLLFCVIFLYLGLTGEKKWFLFAAGVCLGCNVLARFSNLPEAALILGVWGYDVMLERTFQKAGMKDRVEGFWTRLGRHTLWCVLGYLAALAVLFTDLHMRYGLGSYIEGIQRLLAMPAAAPDYKALSMLKGLARTYWDHLYWMVRICLILAAGTVLYGAACRVQEKCLKKDRKWARVCVRALGCATGLAVPLWLYSRHYASFLFYSYDSMVRPGILFLMLAMLIALVRVLCPGCSVREKLFSGMMFLIVVITSIGSNNGVYSSFNNLFLAAPYVVWESVRFIAQASDKKILNLRLRVFPAKCVLAAVLFLCFFQFSCFGATFVFSEGTGVRNVDSYAQGNSVLEGVRMSEERARWMTQISEYVAKENLTGKEVILYGDVPSLSFYLQMPSAFNPWSDLDSYSAGQMESELEQVSLAMEQDAGYRPVIMVEKRYQSWIQENQGAGQGSEVSPLEERVREQISQDAKWDLLRRFMEDWQYELSYENEKFAVYR